MISHHKMKLEKERSRIDKDLKRLELSHQDLQKYRRRQSLVNKMRVVAARAQKAVSSSNLVRSVTRRASLSLSTRNNSRTTDVASSTHGPVAPSVRFTSPVATRAESEGLLPPSIDATVLDGTVVKAPLKDKVAIVIPDQPLDKPMVVATASEAVAPAAESSDDSSDDVPDHAAAPGADLAPYAGRRRTSWA